MAGPKFPQWWQQRKKPTPRFFKSNFESVPEFLRSISPATEVDISVVEPEGPNKAEDRVCNFITEPWTFLNGTAFQQRWRQSSKAGNNLRSI